MNQRERAQRMVALLTQSFEAGWDNKNVDERINVFEGDILAKVTLPDIEGLTLNEACLKSVGTGFTEGLKFARTVIDMVALVGLTIDEHHPDVDFRGMIRMLGVYAAALPDDEE